MWNGLSNVEWILTDSSIKMILNKGKFPSVKSKLGKGFESTFTVLSKIPASTPISQKEHTRVCHRGLLFIEFLILRNS